MKQIAEVFEEFNTPMYNAVQKAGEPVRKYEKTSTNVYLPDTARFKLVVWFKDGNRRCFFSYDNKKFNGQVITDEYAGFVKLLRLSSKYAGKFKTLIIYANLDAKKSKQGDFCYEILKVDIFGNQFTNRISNFVDKEESVIFDSERMFNLGNKRI